MCVYVCKCVLVCICRNVCLYVEVYMYMLRNRYIILNPTWSKTACATGNIIAVVAVLDIHIDRNQVGAMKPNINLSAIIRITIY